MDGLLLINMPKSRFTLKDLAALGLQEVEPGVFRKCTSYTTKCTTSSKKVKKKQVKEHKLDPFINYIKMQLGVDLIPEYKFHPKRKWRFDYALPDQMLAIECEGGIWTNGRHTRGKGYKNDMEKYNEAVKLGWRLLRYTPDELVSEETLTNIKNVLFN